MNNIFYVSLQQKYMAETPNYKRLFFSFLKKKNVFHEFEYYCSQTSFFERSMFDDAKLAGTFVSCSFVWSKTREGKDFWKRIDEDWKKTIKFLGK